MKTHAGFVRRRRAPAARAICLAVLLPCLLLRAQAGSLVASVVDQAGKAVEDAVVTATPADGRPARPGGEGESVVDQVDKTFIPYVRVVRVGTLVRFPNSDNIRHHVYSFSPPKRFELPLYSGKSAAPVLFDKPGVVVMGCNIHDWMVGYVYVSETPYFGRTERAGTVELRGLPAGEYVVRVWHPEMDGTEQSTARTLVLTEQGVVDAAWTIGRHEVFRPRRAPVPRNSGY
jgi:plastocyanin